MINYKDLMIGNWVYSSEKTKFPMRVVNIGEDCCYLDFEDNEGDVWEVKDKDMMPIEVTEELLLKLGFVFNEEDKTYDNKIRVRKSEWNDNYGVFWECEDVWYSDIYAPYFKYIHELQNIFRLITKSDLEIKEL